MSPAEGLCLANERVFSAGWMVEKIRFCRFCTWRQFVLLLVLFLLPWSVQNHLYQKIMICTVRDNHPPPPSPPTPALSVLFQKVRTFMIILNSKLASIKSSDSGVSVKPSCFINGVLLQNCLDPFSVSGLAGSCACRHVEHHVLCSYLVVGVLLHPISCVVFLPGCWCTFASHIMRCVLTWFVGVLSHPISCVVFLPGCWRTFASHIMRCVLTWLLVYFCIPLSLAVYFRVNVTRASEQILSLKSIPKSWLWEKSLSGFTMSSQHFP